MVTGHNRVKHRDCASEVLPKDNRLPKLLQRKMIGEIEQKPPTYGARARKYPLFLTLRTFRPGGATGYRYSTIQNSLNSSNHISQESKHADIL